MIPILVWQKLTQHGKAVTLQLKKKGEKSLGNNNVIFWFWFHSVNEKKKMKGYKATLLLLGYMALEKFDFNP